MEPRGKFDAKNDKGVFLGYCSNSRAYRVYNKITMAVTESINVRVDDYLPLTGYSRPKEPPIGLFHEEGNTLNIPKDVPALNDGNNIPFSIDVRTIPEIEHQSQRMSGLSKTHNNIQMTKTLLDMQKFRHKSYLRRFIRTILPLT